MATRPKLILIDGHSLAYRAFFAMANTPLSVKHPDGSEELTGAVFAFCNMLLKVWKDQRPDFIAVAFDVGRTFRDDLFDAYKGTREKMPDDLATQIHRIQHIISAMGIPSFTAEGFEADDVIGTLARRASGEGMDVLIVTGDRDALQLVTPAVRVLTSGRSFEDVIIYDEARVKDRYGVEPRQMIDYKALVGDTSDNVPGVRGVGEKTAQALIVAHGTLDGIYAHLAEITAKRARTALETDKDSAYLSRTLVTIRTDVPLDVDWEACRAGIDRSGVLPLLRELHFDSLIKRLPGLADDAPAEGPARQPEENPQISLIAEPVSEVPPAEGALAARVRLVASDADYKLLLKALNTATRIAFDTETTSTDPLTAELVGMSFCVEPDEAWYLPCAPADAAVSGTAAPAMLFDAAPPPDAPAAWQLDPMSAKFEPVMHALRQPAVELIAHNSKFDLGVLLQHGYGLDKPVFDTMLAQFVCAPESPLGLKPMAQQLLDITMTEISELIGSGKKQISMRDVPIERVAPYAAADARVTLLLADKLKPELNRLGQAKLLHDVELPLVPVLLDMERSGVALDVQYLGTLSVELEASLRELEARIFDLAGDRFNLNSPIQMSDVLFGRLGLSKDGVRKTSQKSKAGGAVYSVNADVLDSLRGKHAIIEPIEEYRELSKLKGTYVDALPALVNPTTGRLHTSYNQAGAITGRLSSSNPNLQNIPNKSEMGRRVRKAFMARRGWRLISADYSQVELRILAHLADDATLKEAFARGEDIHASTAAAIYDVPLAQVNPMQRSFAKRVNFGIAYGMGAFALAQNTGMTQGEASDFIKRYFSRFTAVKAWLDETKRRAAEDGFSETVLGRRRYFPDLRPGGSEMLRRRAEREAINHPVQGSAADIMKIAMVRIHHALDNGRDGAPFQCRMILQVHDELVFDCPFNEVEAVTDLVRNEMETAYPLTVTLKADVRTGRNWAESD